MIHIHHSTSRYQRVRAFAAVFAASALLLATAPAASGSTPFSDPAITDAVKNELFFDQIVPFDSVSVRTKNGIVTLSGAVQSLLAHDRAERIAETVKGVRGVVNRIEVAPSVDRTPAAIATDVEDALFVHAAIESREVEAEADSSGRVTLTGTAESWAERHLAEQVARKVRGVTAVKNEIAVEHEARSDADIEEEIEARLRWNVLVDEPLTHVEVENGVVRLTGTVGSAAEKRKAAELARVAGVRKVDTSGLVVSPEARDKPGGGPAPTTDPGIESAIRDALTHEPLVNPYDVAVSVDSGIVRLSGVVETPGAKRAAERAARHTAGVVAVRNNIQVKARDELTDAVISRSVKDALRRNPLVDAFQVDVAADSGVVTLTGKVDYYREKAEAEVIASTIRGVVQVRNRLSVSQKDYPLTYDPYVDDWPSDFYGWYDFKPAKAVKKDTKIAADLKTELLWSPFIEGSDVRISVENGVVTLDGTVESRRARNAATENAYEAGATDVLNKLTVEEVGKS